MKETYQKLQSRITADEALIERTLAAAELRPKRRLIRRYIGIAAAAACLVMVGSVPVLAQNVPEFYYALYKIAPETAERFKPLEMISESNGIRMEVGGIYFHENTVEAYITMQDLEGDRLGAWESFCSVSSLMPDLSIYEERMSVSIQKHELSYAGYDAESKTLTLLLSIEFISGDLQTGDEVTFDLDRILGNGVQWEGSVDMIAWQTLDSAFCEKDEMHIHGSSTMAGWEYLAETKMIRPSRKDAFPAECVMFTGAGYQDGLLHVQVYIDDMQLNNDGVIWLEKQDGTQIYSVAELHGCEDRAQMQNLTAEYKEFVFNVSEAEAAECALYGRFSKFTDKVEGEWNVTFTLPEEE